VHRQCRYLAHLCRVLDDCHYLRARTPDANVGYSIFIYRLTPAEIAEATTGSLAQWQGLIERTRRGGTP